MFYFQPLQTDRLLLRMLRPEDAPCFFTRLGSSHTVTKYMLWQPHSCLEDSVKSIQKALKRCENGESFRWAITLRVSGELIGIIDLIPRTENQCTFAYMLGADFWNQGYGSEALDAVIAFAFSQWGIREIVADHFSGNHASGAVMRKVGMTQCCLLPGKYAKNGTLHDAIQYRITREEWARSHHR